MHNYLPILTKQSTLYIKTQINKILAVETRFTHVQQQSEMADSAFLL